MYDIMTCMYYHRFVAYFLGFGVVAGSFYYTVEVGGTFGPVKSGKWCAAFATSILESIFMSQPIKVSSHAKPEYTLYPGYGTA